MKDCCRYFFEANPLSNILNEPLKYCPYCGRKLTKKEMAKVLDNPPNISKEKGKKDMKSGHRIKKLIGYTYKEWFDEFSKAEAEIFFPTIATRKDYDIKVAVTIEEIDQDKEK